MKTSFDTDTMIYVGIAMVTAGACMTDYRDPRQWLGVVGAGLVAWKAKRSPGKAESKAESNAIAT